MSKTTLPAPHTAEPWRDDNGYRVYGPNGQLICEFKHFDGQAGDCARVVAVINALSGIADPAAFVARAKAIEEAARTLVRCNFYIANKPVVRYEDISNLELALSWNGGAA